MKLVKVFRGSSWRSVAGYCRSASRGWYWPSLRDDDLGFRLVCFKEKRHETG